MMLHRPTVLEPQVSSLLEDLIPYSSIYVALFVCAVGCVVLHLDGLREHRTRTAHRNAASFTWRH